VIDARKESGKVIGIKILAEKGGIIQLQNPFHPHEFEINGGEILEKGKILKIKTSPGKRVEINEKD